MWIPWCNSQADFDANHAILMSPIAFGQPTAVFFAIWQQGDYVRHSKDGRFYPDGALVPGNATVNGDRSVEITGTTLFDTEIKFY